MSVRFQPYCILMLDSHSAGGFASRQLVTFPTYLRKLRFIRYLRTRCQARRRGNWAIIPGNVLIQRAMSYAARHWSYVYDLPLRRAPCYVVGQAEDEMDEETEERIQPEVENVAEEELVEGQI